MAPAQAHETCAAGPSGKQSPAGNSTPDVPLFSDVHRGVNLNPASCCADEHFATLQARAALAGIALIQSADERGAVVYVVTQGAWTRELHSIDEVEAWLDRATGARHGGR